jgi:hypothetical protein
LRLASRLSRPLEKFVSEVDPESKRLMALSIAEANDESVVALDDVALDDAALDDAVAVVA